MKNRFVPAAGVWALAVGCLFAQAPAGDAMTPEEFEAKLGYETGKITLLEGAATIDLPESFRFLGVEGSRRLLTQGWGNPADSADGVLGMLIPTSVSPLSQEGWGIVITYDQDGYVHDKDAASIDFAKMLKQMQEATTEANAERKKAGFAPVTLVGWAEAPSYNQATHKLYWAKELAFSDSTDHTLNYNIRILGRRGVLVLNAVASMPQLAMIREQTGDLLATVNFNEGHRYADYMPGKDKAAAYGIGGLIVGAAAAKAGFFKVLWVGLLAFKKAIVVGVVGLGAAIRKWLGRGKSEPATTA